MKKGSLARLKWDKHLRDMRHLDALGKPIDVESGERTIATNEAAYRDVNSFYSRPAAVREKMEDMTEEPGKDG